MTRLSAASIQAAFACLIGRPALLIALLLPLFDGCSKPESSSNNSQPPAVVKSPTIVSFVPAATDLLLAMGAGDHLAGVSNFDVDPRVATLPHVGDYLTTDWEKLTALRPDVVITQFPRDRIPQGFSDRAKALKIADTNLQIHRLDDIYEAVRQLGQASDEIGKASQYGQSLRARLSAVRASVASLPPTRALIVIDDNATHVAGTGNYLDDVLQLAGGVNVVPVSDVPWPAIDRERLADLAPGVILQLLPVASSQVQERAAENWRQLPNLPAVRDHRVVVLTDARVLLPGDAVGELAEQFAGALHPRAASEQSLSDRKPAP